METNLEQTKQVDLKTKLENLRAEGKSYREIAQIAHVSIAQISRTLNQPNQQHEEAPVAEEPFGITYAEVFQLLEKGAPLPNIVIQLKKEPKVVQGIYKEWVELKQMDVNQPNLSRLDSKLKDHILSHSVLDSLLEHAGDVGSFRKDYCRSVDSNGFCTVWNYPKENGSQFLKKAQALRCAFCDNFTDTR